MEKGKKIAAVLKMIVIMYVITGILLLILTLLLWKFQLKEQFVSGAIIAVYIFSSFTGGLLMGKKQQNKKLFWGLFMGLLYFGILSVGSIFLQGNAMQIQSVFTTLILCTASGMAGGMIA